MVVDPFVLALWSARPPLAVDGLIAVEQSEPLLRQLDPETRARVVLAIVTLIFLGLAAIGLIWLGARYLRKVARKPLPPIRSHEEDWFSKPLVSAENPPDPNKPTIDEQ